MMCAMPILACSMYRREGGTAQMLRTELRQLHQARCWYKFHREVLLTYHRPPATTPQLPSHWLGNSSGADSSLIRDLRAYLTGRQNNDPSSQYRTDNILKWFARFQKSAGNETHSSWSSVQHFLVPWRSLLDIVPECRRKLKQTAHLESSPIPVVFDHRS
jgi:hypothetical protein